MRNFLKSIIKSRVGQTFYITHLITFVICVVNLRGLSPHEIDSHFLGKIFIVISIFNYPFSTLLLNLAKYLEIKPTNFRDLIMAMILSIQWWLIGFILESTVRVFIKLKNNKFRF